MKWVECEFKINWHEMRIFSCSLKFGRCLISVYFFYCLERCVKMCICLRRIIKKKKLKIEGIKILYQKKNWKQPRRKQNKRTIEPTAKEATHIYTKKNEHLNCVIYTLPHTNSVLILIVFNGIPTWQAHNWI